MDCALRRLRLPTPARGSKFVLSISSIRDRLTHHPLSSLSSRPVTSSARAAMSSPESTAVMPPMMYGTAWKKERTANLVYEAIKAGFRGIDTAAMKKHYDEALTGEGIRRAIREGIVTRKDLFIQTKFTPNDTTSSYDPRDPIPSQIHASITASLANLSTANSREDQEGTYLDALIMHSPYPSIPQTLEAWATLQSYLPSSTDPARRGRIRRLGISNVSLPIVQALSSYPGLAPPLIVQNRFRAGEREWDRDVRRWCAASASQQGEVKYQGFWTLTGNVATWQAAEFVRNVAEGAGVSLAAAWYVLVMELGVVVLNGTGDAEHMKEDLEAAGRVRAWRATGEGGEVWSSCWKEFKGVVGG